MKLAVIAYVPPIQRYHPEVFVDNMRRWRSNCDLILFSENWPDTLKIAHSPEIIKSSANVSRPEQRWWVNNMIFFTALRIARKQGVTHMLYVESDSRAGRLNWADLAFEEFFKRDGALIGGSMVVYNPCNAGPLAAQYWAEVCALNTRKNFPIPTYGFKGAADSTGSCVFVNGSLGIYDMALMAELFNLDNTAVVSRDATAWDMEIGVKMWEKFGPDAYAKVAHLTSIFSSFGEVLTTEAQRMDMLRRGEFGAVHQVKSAATL